MGKSVLTYLSLVSTTEHADLFTSVFEAVWTIDIEGVKMPREKSRALIQEQNAHIMIAFVGSTPAGYLHWKDTIAGIEPYFLPVRDLVLNELHYKADEVVTVVSFGIVPAWRRKGVARELAMEWVKDRVNEGFKIALFAANLPSLFGNAQFLKSNNTQEWLEQKLHSGSLRISRDEYPAIFEDPIIRFYAEFGAEFCIITRKRTRNNSSRGYCITGYKALGERA